MRGHQLVDVLDEPLEVASASVAYAVSAITTLYEMRRRHSRQVLSAVGGNKTHVARVLGIDRHWLYRRLDKEGATSMRPKRASERHAET